MWGCRCLAPTLSLLWRPAGERAGLASGLWRPSLLLHFAGCH